MNIEKLKEYLTYNPDTGDFYWIADTNPRGPSKIGQRAGAMGPSGYIIIGIFGMKLYAHRLAWAFVYGEEPNNIDHINNYPWDNRIVNIRDCSHAQNIAAIHSEAKGYEVHGAKYRARIDVDGIRHELGSFNTPEEATAAYQEARQRLLGDFA